MANTALDRGQQSRTSANAVANAANPGVAPPNYLTTNHYTFHHRLGENIRNAPVLLGMEDVTLDLGYPSAAMIDAVGPAIWDVLNPAWTQPPVTGQPFPPIWPPKSFLQVQAFNIGGGTTGAWIADALNQWTGGTTTFSTTSVIDVSKAQNPAPAAVYQTIRYGTDTPPNMIFTASGLTAGLEYLVRLHFAEIGVTGAGQRVFTVVINGADYYYDIDIFALTGGQNIAITRQGYATARSDGTIQVSFLQVAGAGGPIVNGIEILSPQY